MMGIKIKTAILDGKSFRTCTILDYNCGSIRVEGEASEQVWLSGEEAEFLSLSEGIVFEQVKSN